MIDFSHANLFIFCSGVCSHLKNTTLHIELCSKLSKLPTLEFHGRVVTAMEIHSHDLCYTFGKRTYEIEFYFYLFLNNTIGRNVMDTQILFLRQTSNKSTENIFCGTNAIRDTKLPKSGERGRKGDGALWGSPSPGRVSKLWQLLSRNSRCLYDLV